MSSRLLALGFSLLSFGPLTALAQDDDPGRRAAAQVLFDQASVLMDKRDYAHACPKLEEVTHLQPGKIGTLLALGECYEGAGRVASAWTTYRQAADRATTLNDPRVHDAQRKVDAVAPRLPRLDIQVDAATKGVAGLQVKRDGVSVGAATWGVPLPIDPGAHVIDAAAPGYAPLHLAVTLREGEAREVAVALALAASPSGAAQAAPNGAGSASGAEPGPTGRGRRTAGFVIGGIGVAGLGAAGVLGIVTLVKVGSLPCADPSDACTARRSPIVSDAKTMQSAGFAMLGVGAAAAIAGVVLVVTAPAAPRTPDKAAAPSPVVTVSANLSGVSLRGAW